jgi:hypothetical protein
LSRPFPNHSAPFAQKNPPIGTRIHAPTRTPTLPLTLPLTPRLPAPKPPAGTALGSHSSDVAGARSGSIPAHAR